MPPHRRPSLPWPLIQIAGVHDLAEATLLAEVGVDLIGLPLRLPVNTEDLTETAARDLVRASPLPTVLITYESTAAGAQAFGRELGVEHLQLHGAIPLAELAELRAREPQWILFKSLIIRPDRSLEDLLAEAHAFAPYLDAFITDSFDPTTGAEGATGLTHDWAQSRSLVEALPDTPVILAGGLTAKNVAAAIHAVRPAGVDAHTGVEGADGRKDHEATQAFVHAARAAWEALENH